MPRKSAAKKAAQAAARALAEAETPGAAAPASSTVAARLVQATNDTAASPAPTKAVKRKAAEDDEDDEQQQTAAGGNKRPAKEGCSVYVSGISYESDEDELRAFFKSVGGITQINMPRYHDSGRPRGYAHVDFETPEQAQAAAALDGQTLRDRYLDIVPARGHKVEYTPLSSTVAKAVKKTTRVFVGNLPYTATEESLQQLFGKCGAVVEVRLGVDTGTGRSKGFAYIEFAEQAGADKAMKMNGIEMDTRLLRLDYDVGRMKGSYERVQRRNLTAKAT